MWLQAWPLVARCPRLIVFVCSVSFSLARGGSYAPQSTTCPSAPIIRSAGTVAFGDQALGPKETFYISQRRVKALPGAYRDYSNSVQSFSRRQRVRLPDYVRSIMLGPSYQLPRVSGAISGGGLRASFVGAGFLNAFDARNTSSARKGTGGLLQAMDYITGLSGGACLVMSMSQANFAPVYDLAVGFTPKVSPGKSKTTSNTSTEGWLADMNFIAPAGLSRLLENPILLNLKWWTAVAFQVTQKARAGFDVSLGDVYARILAYHFVNGTTRENFFDSDADHGKDETMSSLASVKTIQSYNQPFPIITSVPQSAGQGKNLQEGDAVPLTNNQYEFNIYESGSWDPNLATFVDTSYLGSTLINGNPSDTKKCMKNFDNLGFLIATSSNIFRKYDSFASLFLPQLYRPVLPALKGVLSLIPNPFYGLGKNDYLDRGSQSLELMDGSFGGENIPFAPLLVPARRVDVILAFDASDDQNGWADGTSLKRTSTRSKLMPNNSYPFPHIPENVSQIDASRPTLFGCEESGVPLVIYFPNSQSNDPTAPATNLPTFSIEVSQRQAVSLLEGGTNLATRGFPNDPLWPACLACAVVDRSRRKSSRQREGLCVDCFRRYCFREKV